MKSIHNVGVLNTCLNFCCKVEEQYFNRFDRRYGTDTYGEISPTQLTTVGNNVKHSRTYETISARQISNCFNHLLTRQIVSASETFVDFGCGKGRVLLLAAQAGFASVKGVEFSKELCDIANRNIDQFKKTCGLQSSIHVYHDDVTQYSIEEADTIFYFFNPFSNFILNQVVENIKNSCLSFPRELTILYTHSASTELSQPGIETILSHGLFQSPIQFNSLGKPFYIFKIQKNQ